MISLPSHCPRLRRARSRGARSSRFHSMRRAGFTNSHTVRFHRDCYEITHPHQLRCHRRRASSLLVLRARAGLTIHGFDAPRMYRLPGRSGYHRAAGAPRRAARDATRDDRGDAGTRCAHTARPACSVWHLTHQCGICRRARAPRMPTCRHTPLGSQATLSGGSGSRRERGSRCAASTHRLLPALTVADRS